MKNINKSSKKILTSGNHSFIIKKDEELEMLILPAPDKEFNLKIQLVEPGASLILKGLAFSKNSEKTKATILVEHSAPHTTSNQLIKAIAKDSSEIVILGKIKIDKGADGAEAHLMNKNLLLSNKASIESRPELEIDHDNVICSHGSATGQLDQEALFYLQSRGLSLKESSNILLESFVKEILEDEKNQKEILDYIKN